MKLLSSHVFRLLGFSALTLFITNGCSTTVSDKAYDDALDRNRDQTGIEFSNYNRRQELVNDPNTILWCTFSLENPSSPLVTIPVQGKLTSSGKRPFYQDEASTTPGSDGMFGSSGEYRYGFGPGGIAEYYELDGLASFCTTQPTVWHRQETKIILEVDQVLNKATVAAEKALREGNGAAARTLLEKAINSQEQQ
ncbi:MAG: hypothetical protein ACFCUV_25665 [Rivularia sp. (in: cyanobacteria)]